jgi:glycosyltransferase involved in cell wall biosynthesis
VTGRPIVCLSSQYWDGGWFRKQHFMTRFAQCGNPVLYVEPSHSIVRRAGYDGRTRNPMARSRCRASMPALWVLTPSRLPPRPHRTSVSESWHSRIVADAERWAVRLGMKDPLWWVYDPEYAPALDHVAGARLVFDLVDDLAEYNVDEVRKTHVRACIERLASRAGTGFCTSEPLQALLSTDKRSAHVVPNGYDSDLFRPDRGCSSNAGNAVMRRPKVGFVGTLFDFIDYGLLADTARHIPRADFLLLGHVESHPSRVAELFALPNVEHVDAVHRMDVPAHLAGFDVCVAPFRRDAVARSVSPLKIYEYLAMHKPVVCTPMEGLQREAISRFIDFASDARPFAALVSDRLDSWHVDLDALDADLRTCTWDARFEQVLASMPVEALRT